MADKKDEGERFLAERVHALALVHLTRRHDLVVRGRDEDLGLEFLVDVVKDERPTLRRFGVALRGAWPAVTQDRASKALGPTMQSLRRMGPFPFPVCLFYFTMAENQGYYTWVAEPIVTPESRPKIQSHEAADCKPLDKESLGLIVNRVKEWYDAFFAAIAV